MPTTIAQAVEQAEAAIRHAARQHLPHGALYLFGSRARGTARRRSDFDLAILPKPGCPKEYLAFTEALESSPDIIYTIDLVEWHEASEDLQQRILQERILWKS